MSVLSFAQWVQSTAFFTALRGSAYVYPIVLSTHMIAIALFGGMILLLDVRLLGWTMRSYTLSEMVNQLRPLKRIGFLLLITCGLLMAGCKAEEYYYNAFFRTKMTLLALVTKTIRPDTVFIPYHWPGTRSANQLTHRTLDPRSKIPEFKVSACTLQRASIPEAQG